MAGSWAEMQEAFRLLALLTDSAEIERDTDSTVPLQVALTICHGLDCFHSRLFFVLQTALRLCRSIFFLFRGLLIRPPSSFPWCQQSSPREDSSVRESEPESPESQSCVCVAAIKCIAPPPHCEHRSQKRSDGHTIHHSTAPISARATAQFTQTARLLVHKSIDGIVRTDPGLFLQDRALTHALHVRAYKKINCKTPPFFSVRSRLVHRVRNYP